MPTITEPLRLAVGSHQAGSGKGCAMNVISWESGDTTITDFPDCADPVLARIVQYVNDEICTHRDGDLLCPECSVAVLDLGHRTVGTGQVVMSDLERRRLWVRIAADQARQVLHLAHDRPKAEAAIEAAEAWASSPTPERAANARHATYAIDAATHAAITAAAAITATYAIDAATHAAITATAARLRLAHRAVDKFEELTGFRSQPTSPEVTACAVEKMKMTRETASV